jgi:hypothetical protein
VIDLTFWFLLIFAVWGVFPAYRNGVRDGYQNTWLPHVKKQIKQEGLKQGDSIE